MDSQTAPHQTQGYQLGDCSSPDVANLGDVQLYFFHTHTQGINLSRCPEDDAIPPDLSSLVRGRVNEYLQQRLDNPAFHSRLFVNEEEQLLACRL